jgi:hypothetical protein
LLVLLLLLSFFKNKLLLFQISKHSLLAGILLA